MYDQPDGNFRLGNPFRFDKVQLSRAASIFATVAASAQNEQEGWPKEFMFCEQSKDDNEDQP